MTDIPTPEEEYVLKQYELIAPCIEEGVSHKTRAAETGVDRKTISRLVSKFKAGGIDALCRKTRSDKGCARVSFNTFKFIKGKLLTYPSLSFATIQRQLNRLGTHTEEYGASYQQIRSIRKNLSEDLVVLARSEREFEETRELLLRHEAEFPNDMWQCDHKFLDIFVWDSDGTPVKPVLTVVLDDYSRAVMGYYLDLDPPSAQRTAIALRQAIWKKENQKWLVCGIPDHFYTDRGTDFRSLRIQQIAADLTIQLRKRRSHKPQGGGKIERFFLTVNQLLMSELTGYTPEDAPPATPGMDIGQLQTLFDRWVIDEYMHKQHSEIGTTPFERWSSHHQHPRLAPSLESLDILLMTVPNDRTVHQSGIRIFKNLYSASEFNGLVDASVTVRYDPQDISYVLVYLNNEFICRAVCAKLAEQKPSLKEHMRARALYKRSLRDDIKASVSFSDSCTDSQRKVPEVQPAVKAPVSKNISRIRRYSVDE